MLYKWTNYISGELILQSLGAFGYTARFKAAS